jgi:hypothetical protein
MYAPRGRRDMSPIHLDPALDRVSGQRHAPAALYPREMTSGRLVWTQRIEEKTFAATGD